LRQEGYVVGDSSGKQQRLSVAPLTLEDAREVFGILAEVEGLGARWAAGLAEKPRARLAKEMREINTTLSTAARRVPPDPSEVFDLHTDFHARYMAVIRAPRLRTIHRAIKPQADRYRRIYSSVYAQDSQDSIDEHLEILRSLEQGDVDAVQRAVQLNWRNAADRLVKVIEMLGERGSW